MPLIDDHRRTLYLTTTGTQVGLDHDSFELRRPGEQTIRTPVRGIDSIVCIGNISLSTAAMARCAQENIPASWYTRAGRFRFALRTPTSGNSSLRLEQYRAAADATRSLVIAQSIVGAKLLNSRVLLLDAAKDKPCLAPGLRGTAASLAELAERAGATVDLDTLRGFEGIGAKKYFSEWTNLLAPSGFTFTGRVRRPPLDPVNALLSFGYALLQSRCLSAAEHYGLDPHIGFLHTTRPGRPSLALDLMEELRAPIVDRLVLNLLNRSQLTANDFEREASGACRMTPKARSAFLTGLDAHLQTATPHRAVEQNIERRKIPEIQALLLARHLRGDLPGYPPYRTFGR